MPSVHSPYLGIFGPAGSRRTWPPSRRVSEPGASPDCPLSNGQRKTVARCVARTAARSGVANMNVAAFETEEEALRWIDQNVATGNRNSANPIRLQHIEVGA
jgi:hypothetical protein